MLGDFTYSNPTRLYFGQNALDNLRRELEPRGKTVLLVYGGIMNPAAMLMYQPSPSWSLLLAYYIQGVPVDVVHAASTFLFLWLLSEPMLEKLDRVKTKYGLYR